MSWKDVFPKEDVCYETENGILYCGDALEILKKFPSESIDLVITDPPYAISKEEKKLSRKRLSSKTHQRNSDITLDFGEWDRCWTDETDYFNWVESWMAETVRILKYKSWLYIFFDKQKIGIFDLYLAKKYNLKSKTIFVWLKTNPTPSFRKMNWLSASEFIWVGSKGVGSLLLASLLTGIGEVIGVEIDTERVSVASRILEEENISSSIPEMMSGKNGEKSPLLWEEVR